MSILATLLIEVGLQIRLQVELNVYKRASLLVIVYYLYVRFVLCAAPSIEYSSII